VARTKQTAEMLQAEITRLNGQIEGVDTLASFIKKAKNDPKISADISSEQLAAIDGLVSKSSKEEMITRRDALTARLVKMQGSEALSGLTTDVKAALKPLADAGLFKDVPQGFLMIVDVHTMTISWKPARTRTSSGKGKYVWEKIPSNLPTTSLFTEKTIVPDKVQRPPKDGEYSTYEAAINAVLPGFPAKVKESGKSVSFGPSGTVLQRLEAAGFHLLTVEDDDAVSDPEPEKEPAIA
jgi:hypothetical protein